MSSLNHPNIIKFAGFCRIPPLIVTELCCGGTLAKKIAKAKNNPDMMPWNERLHIVCAYFKRAACMNHFSYCFDIQYKI